MSNPEPFKVTVPITPEVADLLDQEDFELVVRVAADELVDSLRPWGERLVGYEFSSFRELSPSDPGIPHFYQGVRCFLCTYLPAPTNQALPA